ncbi:MAG: Methylmalonyl-CoA carboxyltransferase 5S subunit [Syntrophorhabdus sp. PtaU1.Bin002]|nr:MAG: Methylmalonyl-CoA carboxyltransferase 5S subunit [Syntrophorhabdus sp. PtaB.Bin006]OPY72984.1 MAG: Methylmalonyl-CoA carboxyltransferase 5S subunit [Syntrophorhabdus sp. PtaU1.Bin002]
MAEHKPLKVTDLTLRDGHQSLFATRMKTEDMLPIAEKMDKVGFYSMEVWGGATFDVMTRFLDEDPWQRVLLLKEKMPTTKFQMLLRGQNLVGYRNYADDVVDAFVEKAAEVGIDIFRVFDALNDERNFIAAFKAIKKCKKHVQGTLSYSLTESRLGGPIFNIDYFVQKAKIIEDMGADSLCIKDMAGIISPYDAYNLVSGLKTNLTIPVHLHTHYTSGMGSMSCLKAIEAGVDGIDTCLAPFALRSSHPAVEPFAVTLQGTPNDVKFDLELIAEIDEYLETIIPKYISFADTTRFSVIDIGVLMHQIPGGMISNLVSQLKQAKAIHRLKEVYEEIPKTRKDLGFPPLVTPTSQIVGVQAVFNVIAGRYKMISKEVKDYFYGLYGKPPVAVNEEIRKKALKGYEKGEVPIDTRPGDILEPELPKAREALKGITEDMGDILIYALYPMTGLEFLKKKYGL